MKFLGLLAIGLLLGTASMAQETKTNVRSTQKSETTAKNNKSQKSLQTEAKSQNQLEQEVTGTDEVLKQGDDLRAENQGTVVSDVTKTVEGSSTGQTVSEVASSLAGEGKAENIDNHGGTVSTTATSAIDADVKGSTVSTVASSIGNAQSSVKQVVTDVNVTGQNAVKANVNTKVDVKPANVKVRTGLGIK